MTRLHLLLHVASSVALVPVIIVIENMLFRPRAYRTWALVFTILALVANAAAIIVERM